MKKGLSIMALAAMALTACQQNSFKIDGTAEGFEEGDTLFITNDMNEGTPVDTLIVHEGKFSYKGESDSIGLWMVYSKKQPFLNVTFFNEPGTIVATLAQDPGKSLIAGTKANDGWQKLNDMTARFTEKMQQLAEPLYTGDLADEQQKALLDSLNALQADMNKSVVRIAEDNIDNELGLFILTNFSSDDESFDNAKRRELIDRLPAKTRERKVVKELEEMLKASASTEKGQKMKPFTLPTPDGGKLSIMDEIGRHELTILDFWASWCGPCREEMPRMKSLYEQYQEKGLGIIGISVDEDEDAWKKAIDELQLSWTQTRDTKEKDASIASCFQVQAIPYMVVVAKDGTILEKGLRGEPLQQFVAEKLK